MIRSKPTESAVGLNPARRGMSPHLNSDGDRTIMLCMPNMGAGSPTDPVFVQMQLLISVD